MSDLTERVKEIFKTASLHARAGIDSEKLTFDGLQYAVGNLRACEALVRFNALYDQKHEDYSTRSQLTAQILLNTINPKDFEQQLHIIKQRERAYAIKRHKTWNKYAMRVLYDFEQKLNALDADIHHRAQKNKLKRYQHSEHWGEKDIQQHMRG